nr:complexin-2 isoform X1 [Desmodus rotundus]
MGYSSGSRSESEGGGKGADRPKVEGKRTQTSFGVEDQGDYLSPEEEPRCGQHSKLPGVIRKDLFYALTRPTLPPPPAKFETPLGLGAGAMCWGEGRSQWPTDSLGRAAGSVSLRGTGDTERSARIPVPSSAGDAKPPPLLLFCRLAHLPSQAHQEHCMQIWPRARAR